MVCTEGLWSCSFKTAPRQRSLHYRFEVVDGEQALRKEWGDGHNISLPTAVEHLVIYDVWSDKPLLQPLYNRMFTDVISPHAQGEIKPLHCQGVRLEVEAPTLRQNESLALVGNTPLLGEWRCDKAHRMTYMGGVVWGITLPEAESYVQYKFIVIDSTTGSFIRWEEGENRTLPRLDNEHSATIIKGMQLRDSERWRGAGVAVPVFSLRSEGSFGVGDFADLHLLADWCRICGESIIQILPINDTSMTFTWRDSYPYNANSTFALHPLYLRVESVGRLRKRADRERFEALRKELNALPHMDYGRTIQAKFDYLRTLFSEIGAKHLASKAYKQFLERNRDWLIPYAVYSVLRDKYHTPDFTQWGRWAAYDSKRSEAFASKHQEEVDFYCFLQYHLDKQLHEAVAYCHCCGVTLKGDIPIGVSRCSVDAWTSPELFVMDSSAGAPPDDFSVTGQNWGFPIYNWEQMRKDGYAWWRRRFGKMSEYFDAYRIDHILGFFRIWEVPLDAVNALLGEFNPSLPYTAEEIMDRGIDFCPARDVVQDYRSDDTLWLEYRHKRGYYYPRITPFDTERFRALSEEQQHLFSALHDEFYYRRHNDFWRNIAIERLSMLVDATPMLACGEDLGMIPACVPQVMDEERILSLEIERMPKAFGVEFGDVMRYPYLSICATGTHDMNPLRAWWLEDRDSTQRYYNDVLHRTGEAPQEATAEVCQQIVHRHLLSPAMLTVLPLQDWLAIDQSIRYADAEAERINIPANPAHYWRYRMHLTLEQLLREEQLNNQVRRLIAESGR